MGCGKSKVQDINEARKHTAKPKKIVTIKEPPVEPIKKPPKSTYAEYLSSHGAKTPGDSDCSLRGVTFMKNGDLIVADYKNNKVKLFGADFAFICDTELSSAPWDVCPSSEHDNEVYATVPFKRDIFRIQSSFDRFSKKNHLDADCVFRTDGFCWGITCFEGGLAISVKTSGNQKTWPKPPDFQVHLHEFDGTFKRAIIYDQASGPYFSEPKYLNVTYDDLFLLVSDYKLNTVLCINNEDELIFAYRGMRSPNGIAMDEQKNLHVASFFGDKRVHKVGAHGKFVDGLPFDEDRPLFPHGICYRRSDKIIVLSTDNSLEVYRLVAPGR